MVRIHGNHEGNGAVKRIRDASQNGHMAATYPPIIDFAKSAASFSHFPSVSSSLRNIACPTLQSSKITAGSASPNRDKTSSIKPANTNETTRIMKKLGCT